MPQAAEWQGIGNPIDAAMIFTPSDFVKVHGEIAPASGWMQRWLGASLGDSDSISHLCVGARDACAPRSGRGCWQSHKKLCAVRRGSYHGNRRTVIGYRNAMLSCVLVVGKNAKRRVIKKRGFGG
jgi:hypothetical protein